MMNNEKFQRIQDATLLVMAMFGYPVERSGESFVLTSSTNIYWPLKQLFHDGFMAKFTFKQSNLLAFNNETILKLRKIFKNELAANSPGIRLTDFEVPSEYYAEVPEIFNMFLLKLPSDFYNKKIESPDLILGDSTRNRDYYERYVCLLLLSLSVTPYQFGESFCYIVKDNFFEGALNMLTVRGLCVQKIPGLQHNCLLLTTEGMIEGKRLIKRYLPNVQTDTIDLYSRQLQRRLMKNRT